MSSLLALRPSGPGIPAYCIDAVPYAYSEAGRAQFADVPGIRWVRDRSSPNGRGFYRGAREAVTDVVTTLRAAGIVKVDDSSSDVAAVRPCAPVPAPVGLHDYQVDGAAWLASTLRTEGAALLADDMGLGKSAQAIAALDAVVPDAAVLVIAPAVVVPHWRTQVVRWGVATGNTPRWTILSYEGFQKALRKGTLAAGYAAVVLDEIHYLSNSRSQRSKAVVSWLAAQPQRPLVVGLSGTPMTARPRDLWQPLDVLWPGRFGSWWMFVRRFGDGHYEEVQGLEEPVWVSDGCSRADELGRRLRACMLRRTKADVALQLPERRRICIDVELPAKAQKALVRASAALDWRGGVLGGSVSSLLSQVEAYKVEAAAALAAEVMAAGSRPLILTTRKATARDLADRLGAPCVTGDDAVAERVAALSDAPCGVATMYSVTTGIDLTSYDVVIFTGLDWIPSTLLQAEARIHRIGQRRPCTIYYLIGLGTLDEVVRERVIERLDATASIVGAADASMRDELAGGDDESILQAMLDRIAA